MSAVQDFKDRFSSSTQSFVYPVDTVYRYTDLEDFKKFTEIELYLTNINDKVSIVNVDPVDAQYRLANPEKNITSLKTTNTFENWQNDTVQLVYSLSTEQVFKDAQLGDLIVQSVAGMDTTRVSQSNDLADQYMLNIMTALGRWKYSDMKRKLLGYTNNLSGPIQSALTRISELTGDTEIAILSELRRACSAALTQLVKNKDPKYFPMVGLVEGSVFNQTYIRFYLRESIYKRIFLRGINESNDAILQYMKQILAELFIVCYYPMIHYLYAADLEKYFIARGDFMNMRAATAAKVVIVLNTVHTIIASQNGNKSMTFASTPALQNILRTINNYLNRLANPVFDDPTIKFGDIDLDVRNLSKTVNTQAMSIDDLKKYISQDQLLIRSHTNIYKGVDAALRSKQTQFALIVVFIIVLVIVSFLMMKFEYHLDYLIYGLVGIVVFFLMINMIYSIVALSRL